MFKINRKIRQRFKRSKYIWTILVCFIVFCLNYTIANQLKPPDLTRIIKSGKLRVAMVSQDQIPFFFYHKGNLVGTDVDLAKGIAEALGVELEISRKAKSFNALIPLVINGEVDIVISKLSRTLKRSQQVIFSNPYFRFHQALAFNRVKLAPIAGNDYEIKKLIKNFTGKIGVIVGSSYVNYARLYFPNADIVEYPNWDEVVRAVVKGEVLAAYRDDFEIKKALQTNPDLNLSIKLVVLKDIPDNIAMAFNYSSLSLRDFVNIYLERSQIPTIKDIFLHYSDVFEDNKINFNE